MDLGIGIVDDNPFNELTQQSSTLFERPLIQCFEHLIKDAVCLFERQSLRL
jgi:hypothetical protein